MKFSHLLRITAICILFYSPLYGQVNDINIGAALGIGGIQSISPTITSLNGAIFIEASPGIWDDFYFRVTFLYARKVEYFLPENRTNRYYPFIKVFSFKVMNRQKISASIFVEAGIGPILLNDRVFGHNTDWSYGVAFSSSIGFDLKDNDQGGFLVGIGTEYGTSFSNTRANYFLIFLQTNYFLN